ncbi:PqqD family protein [Yimella sp. cx-573]|nr:PqqD family protein [Yimella sp. cx-573]
MWRKPTTLVWVEADDGEMTYVTSTVHGRVVILSETAATIWQCAERASTIGEIIGRLSAELDIDEDTIHDDVENCVTDLVIAGLLESEGNE